MRAARVVMALLEGRRRETFRLPTNDVLRRSKTTLAREAGKINPDFGRRSAGSVYVALGSLIYMVNAARIDGVTSSRETRRSARRGSARYA
jgi:hypothetical protein